MFGREFVRVTEIGVGASLVIVNAEEFAQLILLRFHFVSHFELTLGRMFFTFYRTWIWEFLSITPFNSGIAFLQGFQQSTEFFHYAFGFASLYPFDNQLFTSISGDNLRNSALGTTIVVSIHRYFRTYKI